VANEPQYKTVDPFDKMIGALAGLPDVAKSPPATISEYTPLLGEEQTFIVQTFRQVDRDSDPDRPSRSRDTVALKQISASGSYRLILPMKVVDAMIRQRELLTTKVRRKIGKEQAAARKARGEKPAFLRGKK
jgi:hypothetical protein